MGLASTMSYVRTLLDGLQCPGSAGNVEAFVAPPDPNIEARNPKAYIWASRFDEDRWSGPRSPVPANNQGQYIAANPAGWKVITHSLDIYITWFDDNSDPSASSSFPLIVDVIMSALRTSQVQAIIKDAATGAESELISLGKKMHGEYAPVKDTASQRMQRYDCLLTCPVEEVLQA